MRFKLLIVGAAIAIVATTVGVSGFTSAEVERQAEVDVVSDTDGLLQINASSPTQVFKENNQLKIDTNRKTAASGVNKDANFTFGGNESSFAKSAFTVTNQDDNDHRVKFEYVFDGSSNNPETSPNVIITAKTPGTDGETVVGSEDTPSNPISLGSGDTLYVSVKFVTDGVPTTEDMNGELKIIV